MPETRKRYSFFINSSQATGLKTLKLRDGINESESIRRAIDAFLRERGVMPDPTDQPSATRKARRAIRR